MAGLGDALRIFGTAALGGAGPSGRAAAASLLNQRRRLAFAEQESGLERQEAERIRQQEQQIAAAERGLELSKAALSNRPLMESLRASGDEQSIEGIKNIGRASLQALGQDPSLIDTFVPEAPGTRIVSTVDPQGRNIEEIVPDVAGTIRVSQEKKPLVEVDLGAKGLTDSDVSQLIRDTAQERSDTENFVRGIDQLIDFTGSENFVGGFTGGAIRGLNSAFQQLNQTLGKEDQLVKKGALNLDSLDQNLSDENVAFLRKAAISGDVREAAAARLAFILAKRLNPDGRISDADVRLSRDILSGSADQASALLQLQNVRDSSIRDFNATIQNRASAIKSGQEGIFEPLNVPRGTDKAIEDMTNEELFSF